MNLLEKEITVSIFKPKLLLLTTLFGEASITGA